MLGSMADRIILSPPERRELQRMSRSRSVRAEDARRARIILSLASGFLSLWAISREERCSINTVRMWRDRFKEQRLPGLWSRHRGRAPSEGIEKLEARIIDWTLHRKPADVLPTGAAAGWGPRSALTICVWPGCGPRRGCSLTGVATTWSAMTPSSRRRRPQSSVSI